MNTKIIDRTHLSIQIWERGAGRTLACGTGAAAVVYSGIIRDLLDDKVSVKMPGGFVTVTREGASEEMYLEGETSLVAEGVFFGLDW